MTFNKKARERYLGFAMSPQAGWSGNFRDLAASVTRMATFSNKVRIDGECPSAEIVPAFALIAAQTLPTLRRAPPGRRGGDTDRATINVDAFYPDPDGLDFGA